MDIKTYVFILSMGVLAATAFDVDGCHQSCEEAFLSSECLAEHYTCMNAAGDNLDAIWTCAIDIFTPCVNVAHKCVEDCRKECAKDTKCTCQYEDCGNKVNVCKHECFDASGANCTIDQGEDCLNTERDAMETCDESCDSEHEACVKDCN